MSSDIFYQHDGDILWSQWRSEAKCRPFHPSNWLTRIWNEWRSCFVLIKDISGNHTLTSCSASCFSLSIYDSCFSDCSHLSHHYSSYFHAFLCSYMDPSYFVSFCWLLVSGKPHHSALLVYTRISQPVGHGRIVDGSRPGIIEIECVLHIEHFNVNVSSSWAANDMIRALLSLFVIDYCNTEVATQTTTLCTTRQFEADRRLMLPWKRNLEAG